MRRVLVIGAGAAGLAAARPLAAKGWAVTVLEAGSSVGGRLAQAEACGAGGDAVRFDPLGTFVSTADRHVLALLAELDASARIVALGPGGLAQTYRGRAASVDASSRLGVARIPGVRNLDALRLVRLDRLLGRYRKHLDVDAPERGAPLDDRCLRDFATLYFGRSVAERWVGPFATVGTGNRADDASRLLFLLRATSHRAASLATLQGGIGRLLVDAAAGLDVRLGARATAIAPLADGGFEVAFETAEGSGSAPADAVVLAVAAGAARELGAGILATAETDFLSGVRYAPGLALALGFEHRPFEAPRRIQVPQVDAWPLDSVSLLPGGATEGLPDEGGLAVALASPDWAERHIDVADDVVGKDLAGVLARLVPGARHGAAFTHIHRQSAWMPRFDAGHFRALADFRRVNGDQRREGRRLYLAGDYLAGPWLDSALGSGGRAARELAADLSG
ncbi:MAG: FAD-dependent oxidoreductase [Deltaproteobacteria bacterium]|nr:FAD-dependent oxidoreductase [Deltaproteobacteria bacterium]MBW2445898.1 FAD-dependent oxidoreductase [Deltaproteobacteria bacterium]